MFNSFSPHLVLLESLQPDPLSDEVEELVERRSSLLVVVHLLLGLLALAAVEQAHLVLVLHVGLVEADQLLFARAGLDAQVEAERIKNVSKVVVISLTTIAFSLQTAKP